MEILGFEWVENTGVSVVYRFPLCGAIINHNSYKKETFRVLNKYENMERTSLCFTLSSRIVDFLQSQRTVTEIDVNQSVCKCLKDDVRLCPYL